MTIYVCLFPPGFVAVALERMAELGLEPRLIQE